MVPKQHRDTALKKYNTVCNHRVCILHIKYNYARTTHCWDFSSWLVLLQKLWTVWMVNSLSFRQGSTTEMRPAPTDPTNLVCPSNMLTFGLSLKYLLKTTLRQFFSSWIFMIFVSHNGPVKKDPTTGKNLLPSPSCDLPRRWPTAAGKDGKAALWVGPGETCHVCPSTMSILNNHIDFDLDTKTSIWEDNSFNLSSQIFWLLNYCITNWFLLARLSLPKSIYWTFWLLSSSSCFQQGLLLQMLG